jgi:hypothetical protein
MQVEGPNGRLWEIENKTGAGLVKATVLPEIGENSYRNGTSYQLYMRRTLQSTATNEPFFYLENNDSTKLLLIDALNISFAPAASGDQLKVELFRKVTTRAGGTSVSAINLNLGGSVSPSIICYDNRETGTAMTWDIPSVTDEFLDFRLEKDGMTTFTYDFKGALIIPKGYHIASQVEGYTGDKVRICLSFFLREVE